MNMIKLKGIMIPNYDITEWPEWEKHYITGDTLAFQAYFPDLFGMLIQVRGQKFPPFERYAHIESVLDGEEGTTLTADGTEVRKQNVDNNRQSVIREKKRAIVIYRALPQKTKAAEKIYKATAETLMFSPYDTEKIKSMIGTNFKNFWNFLVGKRDEPNTGGDPKLLVCCDCDYTLNKATGLYDICPGMSIENLDPSNYVHDQTFRPIAAIGLR